MPSQAASAWCSGVVKADAGVSEVECGESRNALRRFAAIRRKQRGLGSLVIFFSEFAANIGPELFHYQSQSVVAHLRAPDARRVA
jgi:hypothetical protein